MKKPDPTRPSAYKPKSNEAGMSRHKAKWYAFTSRGLTSTSLAGREKGRDERVVSNHGKTYVQVGKGKNVMVQLLTKLSESTDGEYAPKVSGSHSLSLSLSLSGPGARRAGPSRPRRSPPAAPAAPTSR